MTRGNIGSAIAYAAACALDGWMAYLGWGGPVFFMTAALIFADWGFEKPSAREFQEGGDGSP